MDVVSFSLIVKKTHQHTQTCFITIKSSFKSFAVNWWKSQLYEIRINPEFESQIWPFFFFPPPPPSFRFFFLCFLFETKVSFFIIIGNIDFAYLTVMLQIFRCFSTYLLSFFSPQISNKTQINGRYDIHSQSHAFPTHPFWTFFVS